MIIGCCALGAALRGENERSAITHARYYGVEESESEVIQLFPQLFEEIISVKDLTPKELRENFERSRATATLLLEVITVMNDELGWSIERIARWLRHKGY